MENNQNGGVVDEKPEWVTLGVGYGANKKISKLQAAKVALQVRVVFV